MKYQDLNTLRNISKKCKISELQMKYKVHNSPTGNKKISANFEF